jgi:peptidoglycan-associated lipoprotein
MISMRTSAVLALLLAFGLAGCASQPETEPEGGPGPAAAPTGPGGATFGIPDLEGPRGIEELVPGPNDDPQLANLVLYFEFDRDTVRSEFQDMLRAHARFLQGNPQRHVRLEGHTDERGSREYNIGLGERRALSVRDFLLLQGVSAGQISTVSYGEERPAMLGSTEDAYAYNRRVELVYRQ